MLSFPNTRSCVYLSVERHWHILLSFTGSPALLSWTVKKLVLHRSNTSDKPPPYFLLLLDDSEWAKLFCISHSIFPAFKATVYNFLTPFHLIEIIAIVLQWQLGWKESILQQFLNLHSSDNCSLFPDYYSLNLVLPCNLFSLTWKSTTIICHDWTARQTWIYVAQNFQGNRNLLSSGSQAA